MEMREFAKKIQKAIIAVLGDPYEIKLQEVQKNNGVVLQGLMIMNKEQNICPTIYLQPFFDAYEGGVSLSEVVDDILQIYKQDTPKKNVDMSFFRKFELVKDRICYRLIHKERNIKLLEKIPHVPFLDLAICFYYAVEETSLGSGSILIHDTHVSMWQTSVTELMQLAQKNTPDIFPWECNSMESVMRELVATGNEETELDWEQDEFWEEMPMYVLSNAQRIQGASAILYPNLLAEIADKINGDFYILPSSLHEVILLPDNGNENSKNLQNMIKEVNSTQLEPEEVLSDSLYYYSRKQKNISIL